MYIQTLPYHVYIDTSKTVSPMAGKPEFDAVSSSKVQWCYTMLIRQIRISTTGHQQTDGLEGGGRRVGPSGWPSKTH